ncbi:hypothetical protein TruAng_000231 [Truncatella angustata]|nr:hypothetical protein TruAng_000231 [Truncatella angustata]
MASSQLVREYRRTNETVQKTHVDIKLKKYDISLGLDIPDFGVVSGEIGVSVSKSLETSKRLKSSAWVLLAHRTFKASLQPSLAGQIGFSEQCVAEVDAIGLFFPDIQSEAIRICFTAWLGYACAMDDVLETMPPLEGEAELLHCIDVMRTGASSTFVRSKVDPSIQDMTRSLRCHCVRQLSERSFHAFLEAVCTVLRAHVDETRFLQGRITNELSTYMKIRSRTIALDPFFEVIKTEYLPTGMNEIPHYWQKLQHTVSTAVGLQNDLIGLERDIQNGEPLNAAIILMRDYGSDLKELDEALLSECISRVTVEHNRHVAQALELVAEVYELNGATGSDSILEVARHILMICQTHLRWCASAKRYRMFSE